MKQIEINFMKNVVCKHTFYAKKTRNKLDLPLKKSRNLLDFSEEYSPLHHLRTFGEKVIIQKFSIFWQNLNCTFV